MLAPKRNETPVEYWISLWPVAPLFGVAWRFESLMPGATFFRPSAIASEMAAGVANETVRAVEATVDRTVSIVEETAEIVHEATEAAVEALEAPPAEARPSALLDAAPAEIDDLKRIKGVGPKVEAQLNALGVWRLDQLAAFTEADLVWLDANITSVRSSPVRDDWAGQARALL